MTTTPRPPVVGGLSGPEGIDVLRIVWWSRRGYWHGAQHGYGPGRVLSAALAILWWPTAPLLVVGQSYLLARRHARYYMSPKRDAVLAIVATRKGWHIEDHIADRPRTGRGKVLRALIMPKLRAAADAGNISILTTAANDRLAAQYSSELLGLADIGRGCPRGRKMRRDPQPTSQINGRP